MSAPNGHTNCPLPMIRFAVIDRTGHVWKICPENVTTPEQAEAWKCFSSDTITRVRIIQAAELEQAPPSQVTDVGEIRERRELLLGNRGGLVRSSLYRRAVIDTLNWILNGGEAPSFDFVQRCIVCGCTEGDASWCIGRTGKPCHWVEPDLCSACQSEMGEGDLPAPEATLPKEGL